MSVKYLSTFLLIIFLLQTGISQEAKTPPLNRNDFWNPLTDRFGVSAYLANDAEDSYNFEPVLRWGNEYSLQVELNYFNNYRNQAQSNSGQLDFKFISRIQPNVQMEYQYKKFSGKFANDYFSNSIINSYNLLEVESVNTQNFHVIADNFLNNDYSRIGDYSYLYYFYDQKDLLYLQPHSMLFEGTYSKHDLNITQSSIFSASDRDILIKEQNAGLSSNATEFELKSIYYHNDFGIYLNYTYKDYFLEQPNNYGTLSQTTYWGGFYFYNARRNSLFRISSGNYHYEISSRGSQYFYRNTLAFEVEQLGIFANQGINSGQFRESRDGLYGFFPAKGTFIDNAKITYIKEDRFYQLSLQLKYGLSDNFYLGIGGKYTKTSNPEKDIIPLLGIGFKNYDESTPGIARRTSLTDYLGRTLPAGKFRIELYPMKNMHTTESYRYKYEFSGIFGLPYGINLLVSRKTKYPREDEKLRWQLIDSSINLVDPLSIDQYFLATNRIALFRIFFNSLGASLGYESYQNNFFDFEKVYEGHPLFGSYSINLKIEFYY